MIAWWKIPISPRPTQSNQPSQKPKWVGETEIPPNWTQKRPHWHSLKINGCVTHGNFHETKFSELKLSAVYRKSGLHKKKIFVSIIVRFQGSEMFQVFIRKSIYFSLFLYLPFRVICESRQSPFHTIFFRCEIFCSIKSSHRNVFSFCLFVCLAYRCLLQTLIEIFVELIKPL